MRWVRYLISLILLAALIYFFWPLIGEIRNAIALFRIAQWEWLAAGILVQVISYGFLTWLNVLALAPFPGKIPFLKLSALLTAMAFIQAAIPSAGASGIALRVRLLRKYGYAAESSLFSLAVETIAEAVVLGAFVLIGVIFLLYSDRIPPAQVFLLGILVLTGCMLTWYGWRLLMNEKQSVRLLAFLVRLWNRVGGRFRRLEILPLENRLRLFQQNVRCYRTVPVWKFGAAAFGKVIFDIGTLGAAFLLFRYIIQPGALFTGYGLMLTMSGIAALPGGIGMTDAYVPVIFRWLGVPGAVALAAGLTYRLVAYWFLRFIGFISWQYLEEEHK